MIEDKEIEELFAFLKGEEVEGVRCHNQPALTPDQAFTVIWFLQEHLGLIPSNYEMCSECKELFDYDMEGRHDEGEEKAYCDHCDPIIYQE